MKAINVRVLTLIGLLCGGFFQVHAMNVPSYLVLVKERLKTLFGTEAMVSAFSERPDIAIGILAADSVIITLLLDHRLRSSLAKKVGGEIQGIREFLADFSCSELPEEFDSCFAEAEKTCVLKLKGKLECLSVKQLKSVTNRVKACKRITAVDLSMADICRLNPNRFDAFLQLMRSLPYITDLNLSYNGIGCLSRIKFKAFMETIASMKNLTTLKLDDNDLGRMCCHNLEIFTDCLSVLRNLTVLEFGHNDLWYLSYENCRRFVNCLQSLSNLRKLDLSRNRFGLMDDDRLELLASSIRKMQNLAELGLATNELQDRFDIFVQHFDAMRLTSLSIEGNRFVADNLGKFITMLKKIDLRCLTMELDDFEHFVTPGSGFLKKSLSINIPLDPGFKDESLNLLIELSKKAFSWFPHITINIVSRIAAWNVPLSCEQVARLEQELCLKVEKRANKITIRREQVE